MKRRIQRAFSSAKAKLAVVGTAVAVGATGAMADDLVLSDISTTDFTNVAGVVLAAAGIFYGVRRALRLVNA